LLVASGSCCVDLGEVGVDPAAHEGLLLGATQQACVPLRLLGDRGLGRRALPC
jgi:hypothetical protein